MKSELDYIVKVEKISKVFKLPHEKLSTVKQHFVSIFNQKSYEKFKALDEVDFEIKRGEFFGIIGSNGSGKSTLLKILAGIYQPTKGKVAINGSLSPFIELGVGFNPELTARENIFLNAAILGLSRKEIEDRFDAIVDFSELENFLDQKLKNFSSGMQVRLAFSIAIQANADVLLVDEVLAVGDSNFQQKCFEVFREMKKQDKTIIFVSHDLKTIEDFCDRVLLLNKGKVEFAGSPKQTIMRYIKLNNPKVKLGSSNGAVEGTKITKISSLDPSGKSKDVFDYGEDISIYLEFKKAKTKKLNFGVAIYRSDGTYCFGTNTFIDKIDTKGVGDSVKINYSSPKLLPGSYYLIVAIFGENDLEILDFQEKSLFFSVYGQEKAEGITKLDHSWEIK